MMGDLTRNLSRYEFACPCCGKDTVDYELVVALQELRDYYGQPVKINSGCRCWTHHAKIYKKLSAQAGRTIDPPHNSQHLVCRAADFVVAGVRPAEVQAYLSMKYHDRWGIGRGNSFTHLDTRTGPLARWSY